jgi:hypothetical protein
MLLLLRENLPPSPHPVVAARVGTLSASMYALGLVVIWFAPDSSDNKLSA